MRLADVADVPFGSAADIRDEPTFDPCTLQPGTGLKAYAQNTHAIAQQ
jgi:hypothetical protein